jgi:hypothetical protein
MAATFVFSERNGAGEVVTDDIANANMGSVDSVELVPASYPITRGDNSFCKYISGKFTGVWTQISNLKFWKSAGALVTGETIKASANAVYAQPSQVDTGDSDIPTTEGTALSLNSAEGAATIDYGVSGVSGYTGNVRLQTQTTVGSPAGATNQKKYILQYDEI